MMSVTSHLELYLSLFGWYMFGEIWNVLNETNLVYLPFIGMMIKNIAGPLRSQEARDASSTSLRRIEIDLIAMLTVVVLAGQPALKVGLSNLNYTKACSSQGTVNAGATGTTYDTVFTSASLGGRSVFVPVWWTGVLALSGAINDMIILQIPCTADIRLVKYQLHNSRVKDPHLRNQVRLFYRDCYNPAMTRFINKNLPYTSSKPIEDLQWLGADYFVNGGLYDDPYRASREIPGFRYDKNRDREYNPDVYLPLDGKPTCKQWWTGQDHVNGIGLREALINQVDGSVMTQVEQLIGNLKGLPHEEVADLAIKTLLNREESYFNGLQELNAYNNNSAHVFRDLASSAATGLGGFMESFSFYPKMYAVKVAAPIIQSAVLMLIYMFLPFILLFSGFDIGVMMFVSIAIFAIKFWTVIWAVAHWLDNHLLQSLEPDTWFRFDTPYDSLVAEMIIQFVIGGMFIFVPMLWFGMLGWAGYRLGNEVNNAVSQAAGPAISAGEKGGNKGKFLATKGKV